MLGVIFIVGFNCLICGLKLFCLELFFRVEWDVSYLLVVGVDVF